MQIEIDRGSDRLAVTVFGEGTPGAPLFVLVPAMGVPARYYRPFADLLTAAGYAVAAADLRGTGLSGFRASRRSTYGLADLADDVAAVLDGLSTLRAGRPTYLVGHSLGGQAAVLHLARTLDPSVAGLVLVACGLPYWRLFGARSPGVWAFTQSLAGISAIAGYWPGWGFGGRQARGVIRDWAYTARTGRFPASLGADPAAVTTPVLAISVDDDQYTPPPTTDQLTSRLTSAPVTRLHVTNAEAGSTLDHFRWVRAATPIVGHITGWLPSPVRP